MPDNAGHLQLVKLAFLHQYNLILLGGAVAFALALWSPLPIILALPSELVWLALAPTTEGFRRWAANDTMDGVLSPEYTGRVGTLARLEAEIRRLVSERGLDRAFAEDSRLKLEALVGAFSKMSALHQRLVRFLTDTPTAPLEQDVLRLGQALAEETDPAVRLSLRQALSLAQRRLKHHEQIENTLRALDVKMATLEMSFHHMRSQAYGGGSEVELGAELEELITGSSFLPHLEAETGAALTRTRFTGSMAVATDPIKREG